VDYSIPPFPIFQSLLATQKAIINCGIPKIPVLDQSCLCLLLKTALHNLRIYLLTSQIMSGVEAIAVVGLVASIVSALTGAAALIPKGRKRVNQATALDRSLITGSRRVQDEYDQYSTRVGPRFSVGDDIGRRDLSAVVIILQQQLLQTLYDLVGGSTNGDTTTYAAMLSTSDSSKARAITALGEQYQRLAMVAPIVASLNTRSNNSSSFNNLELGSRTGYGKQNRHLAIEAPSQASRHTWHGVTCDVCFNTIVGVRHKCVNCRDYDMCSYCFSRRRAQHKYSHRFNELGQPGQRDGSRGLDNDAAEQWEIENEGNWEEYDSD